MKTKKVLAVLLTCVMAFSSPVISLADVASQSADTITVTFHANGGRFTNPNMGGDIGKGTSSNATPSDGTPNDSDTSVYKLEISANSQGTYRLYESQLPVGSDLENGSLEFYGWLEDKSNISSKLIIPEDFGFIELTKSTNLYAGWLRSAENDSQVITDGIKYNGLANDNQLIVKDLAEKKSVKELSSVLAGDDSYENLDAANAIQLDMGLLKSAGQPVGIVLDKIPDEFKESSRNRSIVVIHYGKNKTEVIDPTCVLDSGGNLVEISFTLTSFSPVIIATVDKLYDVELVNTKGGYLIIYTIEDMNTGSLAYLPIGETSKIKAGTYLGIIGKALPNGSYKGLKVTLGNETLTLPPPTASGYIMQVDSNTVLEGVFEKRVIGPDEPNEPVKEELFLNAEPNFFPQKGKISAQVNAYKETADGDPVPVSITSLKMDANADPNDTANALFSLDANGKLDSKDALDFGRYEVAVTYEYEGHEMSGSVYVEVGLNLNFIFILGNIPTMAEAGMSAIP